jgi:hypothetical protein
MRFLPFKIDTRRSVTMMLIGMAMMFASIGAAGICAPRVAIGGITANAVTCIQRKKINSVRVNRTELAEKSERGGMILFISTRKGRNNGLWRRKMFTMIRFTMRRQTVRGFTMRSRLCASARQL